MENITPTGRIINMWEYNGLSNSISWFDFEERRVVGHMFKKPEVGDELRSKMESGKTARFIVKSVEYQRDPRDMFFADVEDYEGYVEDMEE